MFCFSFLLTRPPWSTLFPYTTLFRSWVFDSAEAGTGSDVEESLANSDVVVERTFRQQRLIPAFMEPRSTVVDRSEEHTSELQSRGHLVCRLLLEKKNSTTHTHDQCTH